MHIRYVPASNRGDEQWLAHLTWPMYVQQLQWEPYLLVGEMTNMTRLAVHPQQALSHRSRSAKSLHVPSD